LGFESTKHFWTRKEAHDGVAKQLGVAITALSMLMKQRFVGGKGGVIALTQGLDQCRFG
jgi:hypothetical protein